jgi:NADH-quinone oxidoreductase subunit D
LIGIGQFDKNFAIQNNLTGVLLRSTGATHDIRLNVNDVYANYFYLNIKSYISSNGDCYDRYLLRITEIIESLSIANQCVFKLKTKKNISENFFLSNKDKVYQNMESLIKHFKN